MRSPLLLVLFVALCFAQQIAITPDWTVTQQQLDTWTKTLLKTDKELTFYHWGPIDSGVRWSDRGRIDQGEVDWFINHPSGQMSGGGFYMSQDKTNSASFGIYCNVITLPAGALMYSEAHLDILGKRYITLDQRASLGVRVPFIHNYTSSSNWWVTHNAQNLQNIKSGYALQPPLEIQQWDYMPEQRMWTLLDSLQKTVRENPVSTSFRSSLGWLSSFYSLFYYTDAIALSRNIRVNPTNPWHEFEPEHFVDFHNCRQYLLEVLIGRTTAGVCGRRGSLGNYIDKATWIKNQTDVVIPLLWGKIAGSSTTKNVTLRNDEVRAGGSNMPGNTFTAPKEEVYAMQKNPYLTVESKQSTVSPGDLEVAYYYPDVFHYDGVAKAGYISTGLIQELTKYNLTMRKDRALRETMTKKLIQELLNNLFSRWYGRSVSNIRDLSTFMIEFVSIHPYADYNGRTTRMYAHLAIYETNAVDSTGSLPHEYISDLDTLSPPSKYGEFTERSSLYIYALMRDMMKELIVAVSLRRSPSYYDLPAWLELTRSMQMFGLQNTVKFDSVDDKYIETRQFAKLFNKIIGPNWGRTLS